MVAIRDYWVPTPEQVTALAALEIAGAVAKTRIDLEVKDLKERSDTISKIMGAVLEKYQPSLMEIEEAEDTVSG